MACTHAAWPATSSPACAEPVAKRWGFLLIVLSIAIGYLFFVNSFGAAAHPGVDQNGYQYGGGVFAETLSTGIKPPNPYTYIGWMYIRTPDGWYYPKYPLGLPIIDAACLWIAPLFKSDGVSWVYRVSPVSTAIAVLAMFFMVRLRPDRSPESLG